MGKRGKKLLQKAHSVASRSRDYRLACKLTRTSTNDWLLFPLMLFSRLYIQSRRNLQWINEFTIRRSTLTCSQALRPYSLRTLRPTASTSPPPERGNEENIEIISTPDLQYRLCQPIIDLHHFLLVSESRDPCLEIFVRLRSMEFHLEFLVSDIIVGLYFPGSLRPITSFN